MKIKGIGMPFSIHQSSCSNRTPKNFEWTTEESDIEVWLDMTIPSAIYVPIPKGKKRYAWFCESRAIKPALRQAFEQEDLLDDIVDSYDAIFTCEKELVDKHENIHFCFAGSNLPWVPDYKLYDKSKLVSFVASSKLMCRGHKLRHQLYEIIQKNTSLDFAIDVYGSIIGNSFGQKVGCHMKGYPGNVWHDKSEALNDYMFSVVMENDKYDSYFTEKLTDCFASGTIPMYYGPRSIGEYFNTSGIIFLDGDVDKMYNTISQLSGPMYHSRMDAIKDNFERVKNMQSSDDMLFEKIQELNS
jgi:hypothetical protein